MPGLPDPPEEFKVKVRAELRQADERVRIICRDAGITLRSGNGGRPGRITDEGFLLAHQLYAGSDASTHDIAEQVWEDFGYASVNCCQEILRLGFRRLGLERRGHSESKKAACRVHPRVRSSAGSTV